MPWANVTSLTHRKFVVEGFADLGNNVDFLKKAKKATTQAHQKVLSMLDAPRVALMANKIEGVIGSFCLGGIPCVLDIPRLTTDSSQFSRGFGRPTSMCSRRTMFKYTGMLEGFKDLAKNTK